MWSLSILFRQCSYPLILRKILTELQVYYSLSLFFSGGLISSFGVDHISSFCFTYLPMWISYPSLSYLFSLPSSYLECWSYLGRFVFPFSIRSCYFEVDILFKLFNCTGAISISISRSTVFPFEWALTHRSFPRILPDSSNFLGAIPKFFSKFDVRMNFISKMSFSKIFQILSSLVQPF